jgi:hypothetical protein
MSYSLPPAAASPNNCWDVSHGHDLGGGWAWVDGYRKMIKKARESLDERHVLITEGNTEAFMDIFDVYLALSAISGYLITFHLIELF